MRHFLILLLGLMLCWPRQVFAQDQLPFNFVGTANLKLTSSQLEAAEQKRSEGVVDKNKNTLTFSQNEIQLVVRTGPEEDMLSYHIQGLRNPTLIVPEMATVRVLFVNVDGDMLHDFRVGAVDSPFVEHPDISKTAGSDPVNPQADNVFNARQFSFHMFGKSIFRYFCSMDSHAQNGMWGTILVGDAAVQNPSVMNSKTAMPLMDHHNVMNMPGMDMQHQMVSSVDLSDPMSREGSGTSWVPDSSPIYAKMKMKGRDMWMLHGMIFPRYTSIGSGRDVSADGQGSNSRFDAPSMFMLMYSHPLDEGAQPKSQIGAHIMMSLDPLIEKGYGYPLLYQSGETYGGVALHDRQHPHDLFDELSVIYSRRVGQDSSTYLYVGYPGEPALGPPTFMHRISGMDIPDAPIGHHWEDATHITFGVATLGYAHKKWKIEGSIFNGSEPDENRYNFDSPKLNSYSARFSWNPTENLALQVSQGFLKAPESLEPGINVRRTTASLIYNKPLGPDSNWATTLLWGHNDPTQEPSSNAYLLETAYQKKRNTLYLRAEQVQKSGSELVLTPALEDTLFPVDAISVGVVHDMKHGEGMDVGLGAQLTYGSNPSSLDNYYGGSSHLGFEVFLRIRPSRLN